MSWQGARIEEISAGHSYSLSGWKIKNVFKEKKSGFFSRGLSAGEIVCCGHRKKKKMGGKAELG